MIFALLLLILFTATDSLALFTKVPGIEHARITKVAASRSNPNFMAVAARNALYTSNDQGLHFKKTASLKDETIAHLIIDNAHEQTVYLAGERQCYQITNTPHKIFAADEGESIHFIAQHQNRIYIATSAGLYYTETSLINWQRVHGLRSSKVYSIESAGEDLYLACDTGVYRYQSDETIQRLFATRANGGQSTLRPQLIKIDIHIPTRLWLCSNKGLFYSTDRGETWQKFYISGADNVSITCLAQALDDDLHFYICTDVGLFRVAIATGISDPIFEGISSSKTNWMDFTEDGAIYLATAHGLFTDQPTRHTNAQISPSTHTEYDPPIQEIQNAALRYNSIHPDKVAKWRRRLKYRALFPKLSVDYDKTIGSSFTKDQHYFAEGPNDWGVSLTWDLGDLIWNDYEDDIDNRAKLTTQLRIDILDEINRIYFERLRLQQEIAATSDNSSDELPAKKLRLRELTATLDGYTGGFLSRNRARNARP